MYNATSTQAFNPYAYTLAPLTPTSPSGSTALPTYMSPPNVSLTGPANNDTFNYAITNPATQQAVAQPLQNVSYPLNATNPLTAPMTDIFSTSSTASNLQAPFVAPKPSTTAANNQNFQIQLTDALNTQPKKVEPPAAVMANPFANNLQTTTIPGYTPPGGNFSMLA